MLSLCAVLCGAEDFEDIAIYGKQKEAFLRRFLDRPNGIPSHDTVNRVFHGLDKDQFASSLYNWSKELLGVVAHYQIAIDGKVLRATATPGKKNSSGICLVSAWAQEQRLVLGQQRVEGKSNEKTAIPELLNGLDDWPAISRVVMIKANREKQGQLTEQTRFYLSSLEAEDKPLTCWCAITGALKTSSTGCWMFTLPKTGAAPTKAMEQIIWLPCERWPYRY